MTLTELGITVGIAAFGTLLCRTLPFLIFRHEAKTPAFIQWLGEQLPRASMAMLVIYCLRAVRFTVCQRLWQVSLQSQRRFFHGR